MSDTQRRPIPAPRANRNSKPPLPKRPEQPSSPPSAVNPVPPEPPPRDHTPNTINKAEVTEHCSDGKLEPVPEIPDRSRSCEPSSSSSPHHSNRRTSPPPPIPRKPSRLSACCSGNCAPTCPNCGTHGTWNHVPEPSRASSEGSTGQCHIVSERVLPTTHPLSPSLPPPKPVRSSLTPSNDSLSSRTPSPFSSYEQPLSPLLLSNHHSNTTHSETPSEPQNDTAAADHSDSFQSEAVPNATEELHVSVDSNYEVDENSTSCDSSKLVYDPPLPPSPVAVVVQSSNGSDVPSCSILDTVVRHASSSINAFPGLSLESSSPPSDNLIDLTSEIPLQHTHRDNLSTSIVKSRYVNLPPQCVVEGDSDDAPPDRPPPPPPLSDGSPLSQQSSLDSKLQSPGFEEGPNGGIWNPGYIGLERYRKLLEESHKTAPFKELKKDAEECCSSTVNESEECVDKSGGMESSSDYEIRKEDIVDGEAVCYSGYVHLMFNKKDRGKLWAVLRSNQLAFHESEHEVENASHGPYEVGSVRYVGLCPSSRSVINIMLEEKALSIHWNHLKLTVNEDASHNWVLLLAKSFMPKDETLSFSMRKVNAAGRVWIRQGATCPWSKGWMHIDKRRLVYILDNCAMVFELDVRKLMGMKSEVAKVDWCASIVGSLKGPFMLTLQGSSLYVQAECDSVTKLWSEVISSEMECVGTKLEDHRLTADDVPIIVDKCIKFLSTYGLYHPGIYRRNGSTVEARLLMEELKRDAVNVHISPTSDDMINVVADVLRSFFRQLEAPLVPCFMQKRLFAVVDIKDGSKLDEYREILMSLSRVQLQTLRRLLDHLKDVTEHANANLATVENISKVFGPTLFSVDKMEEKDEMSGYETMTRQMNVVRDMILNYTVIFKVSLREMHAKSKIDMLQGRANSTKVRADGFLVPIHLLEKDNHTFNVQSSLNAEQVCEAARNRPCFREENCTGNFALFEMIKSGQLQRRVGFREKMNAMVTGRWLDWDPTDCFLLFKRDQQPFSIDRLCPFADDVKIAEPGSKSFSTGHLKLETGTTIVHYNKSMKRVNEWHVDDVLWFTEHESTRKPPPTSHTLTMIPAKGHLKFKSKWIGFCVAFKDSSLRACWLNAVLSSQIDFDAAPTPLVQL